jgi:SAM-dependent methyltransferase
VLDVACGTGIVARIAARKLGGTESVTGLDASAPMITVARAAATAEGVAVEWREASAVELPFTEAAFDVVLCQSGLQFFPDRPASLREMHRVLKPGGRLILSVWGPIERSRGFAVAADALARHIGPEAARPITSGAFGLSDADELRALVTGANFKDITVRASVKILRYPSPDEFILRHITGSPLGSAVGGAGESARTALLARLPRYRRGRTPRQTLLPSAAERRFRTFPPSPLSGEVRPATDLRRDHGVTTGGGTSHITILSEPRIPDKLPHSGQQTPETIAGAGV